MCMRHFVETGYCMGFYGADLSSFGENDLYNFLQASLLTLIESFLSQEIQVTSHYCLHRILYSKPQSCSHVYLVFRMQLPYKPLSVVQTAELRNQPIPCNEPLLISSQTYWSRCLLILLALPSYRRACEYTFPFYQHPNKPQITNSPLAAHAFLIRFNLHIKKSLQIWLVQLSLKSKYSYMFLISETSYSQTRSEPCSIQREPKTYPLRHSTGMM